MIRKSLRRISLVFILLTVIVGHANTIRVAAGLSLPPYIIPEEDTGMEWDIVKNSLKNAGFVAQAVYMPFSRVTTELHEKRVDAGMTLVDAINLPDIFLSDSHITYQDVAIALKEREFQIKTIDDLVKRSVIGYQNAKIYLGAKFAFMARDNNEYRELTSQESQVASLFLGRTDIIVLDINIFWYYRNKINKYQTNMPVTLFQILPKRPNKVGFINEKVRDAFNKGLKQLRASGDYDKIIEKYIGVGQN